MTMVVRHSPGSHRLTLGADKAYDVHEFVDDLRDLNVTPHIAQNTTNRSSAIDTRTTRHPGYAMSQQKRKRTEEPFGWGKTIGGLARPHSSQKEFFSLCTLQAICFGSVPPPVARRLSATRRFPCLESSIRQ